MKTPTKNNSVCIVVLGMHRSGTSAVTRVLNLLGIDIGNNIVSVYEDNPRGFWEHANINRLDDQMLKVMGFSWDDYGILPYGWQEKIEVAEIKEEIFSCLSHDFVNSNLWLVKEPRMTRLIPAWESIWGRMHVSPRFVLMLRHPLEIAASLQKRDGFDLTKSLLLSTRYILDAERYTRNQERIAITYGDLLSDWRVVSRNISSVLNIKFPVSLEVAEEGVEAFLTRSLRHHEAPNTDWSTFNVDRDVIEVAVSAFELISSVPQKEITEEITRITLAFERIVERYPARSQFSVHCRGYLARKARKHPRIFSVLARIKGITTRIKSIQLLNSTSKTNPHELP